MRISRKILHGLAWLMVLNMVMAGVFVIFLQLAPQAMGQLVREPAKAAIADGHGPFYLILLACGAAVYELVCRQLFQKKLASPDGKWRWVGYGLCTVLAGIIYSRFGIIPAIFGLLLGVFTSALYRPERRWFLMLWQTQWQFCQMAITLLIALLMHGECRANYLWAYKLRNIREGNLCYRTDWGWVDASHKHLERFDMISDTLRKASGESVTVTVNEPFVTITRKWLPVVQTYEVFNPAQLSDAERWAVVSGISLDFSKRNEQAQGEVPFYRCSQLSAWQFDDLPSTLLTCLMESPDKPVSADGLMTDQALLEKMWDEQGIDLVRQQFREVRLPTLADQEVAPLLDQIVLAREYWRPLN